MKTGLVLEGGAMRGIYTAGVLDAFMDHRIKFDGVMGVSAGAIHGASYVSGQRGRSIRYYLKHMKNPKFMSFWSLLTTGNLVGTQFCYHDLPKRLDVYDYEAFRKSSVEFYVVCTNVETGEAEYIRIEDMHKIECVQASASMPLVSRIVEAEGKKLLDGGVADSIPYWKFYQMGFRKQVVVLTRPEGYQKSPSSMSLAKRMYRDYPKFLEAMEQRYWHYNDTVAEIEDLADKGELLLIRPSRDPKLGRMEKNPKKVKAVYDLGYADAIDKIEQVKAYL